MSLNQKQIGLRIAKIRKSQAISQEYLAGQIGISRSSLAQIELGNRNLDLKEIQTLALVLKFSIDEFVSVDFEKHLTEVSESVVAYDTKSIKRVSPSELNSDKFRNVLLYILEKCGGKANVGETVLAKLLYFSDFNYFEEYEEHMTGARYKKLPFGPVPQELDETITQMVESSQIQRMKTDYFGYKQTRFIPLVKPDLTILKASEVNVINKVIEQMSDWSASVISDYSHKDMPWLASKEGEDIDYELVFYRESPFSVRNYGIENGEE